MANSTRPLDSVSDNYDNSRWLNRTGENTSKSQVRSDQMEEGMMVGFYQAFASQASAAVERITYEQIDGGTPAWVPPRMV